MIEIILIRHGQTDHNKDNRFTGITDVMLNELGRSQALNLREKLMSERIDIVYSSDLKRCIDTAKLISFNSEIIYSQNLREINFGMWEGKTYDYIKMSYPAEEKKWRQDWTNYVIPGGESFYELSKRVIDELESIKNNCHEKIALITHGGCISILLAHYIIGSLDGCLKFYIDNGTITRLCFTNNYVFLKSLNEK